MQTVGPLLGQAEHAFGMLWSLGEVGLALTRPHHLLRDPDLERVQEDVAERGIHAPFDLSAVRLVSDGRKLTGVNPYRFVADREPERVLAYLDRARRNPRRHLIVVCHCYGVPSPRLMRTLFGLERAEADVVTSVMSHHQPGTYPLWPGSGFTSMLARPHQIEAIRRKYPRAGWHEFEGTHLIPHGLTSFHRIVRDALV